MARGDHLYVHRLGGLYSHHGIDCGDGTVIHLTAVGQGPPGVERIPLERFAEGDEVRVRDYTAFFAAARDPAGAPQSPSMQVGRVLDRARGLGPATPDASPDTSPDAVVARAESRVGERGFDVWLNNCEHFATWCRTGISGSTQVDALWRMALGPIGYWLHKLSETTNASLDRPSS